MSTTTVRGLDVTFPGLPTVHGVDLDLAAGRLTAVVGESGAGKSVLVGSLLGLLPRSAQVTGRLALPGTDADPGLDVDLADRATLARRVRGRRISLVPQSPATWLTPVRTLGSQLHEAARAAHGRRAARTVVERSVRRASERAQLPAGLLGRYPHEVSGGQLQRAALALALVGGARVLLADEPTNGLDPELAERALAQLRAEADSGAAVLVVTHDLAAAERVADDVVVLYAGRVVERSTADVFFAGSVGADPPVDARHRGAGLSGPAHPYAAGLLDALPDRAFRPVAGDPPAPGEHVAGCVFRPRCPYAFDRCGEPPALLPAGPAGAPHRTLVACHRPLTGDTGADDLLGARA